jgi:hypothetical protein
MYGSYRNEFSRAQARKIANDIIERYNVVTAQQAKEGSGSIAVPSIPLVFGSIVGDIVIGEFVQVETCDDLLDLLERHNIQYVVYS